MNQGLGWDAGLGCWTMIHRHQRNAKLHAHALLRVSENASPAHPLSITEAMFIYSQIQKSGTCLYCAQVNNKRVT